MAAECCAFLKTADPTSERWEPYRDWLATLTADDTVVTFNYDRVIETLVAHVKDEYLRNKYQVLLPNESLANDCIHVLKLHGSVDWQRSNGTYWKSHDTSAIKASLDSIAIATPGSHKRRWSRSFVRSGRWQNNESERRISSTLSGIDSLRLMRNPVGDY